MPGDPTIHSLAFDGRIQELQQLLQQHPSQIDARNEDGDTPLHYACWAKQLGVVGVLLAFSPDVNAKGCYGRTPLHYAVHEGSPISVPVVISLLNAGADPGIADSNGFSPADWAKVEMVEGLPDVLTYLHEAEDRRNKP